MWRSSRFRAQAAPVARAGGDMGAGLVEPPAAGDQVGANAPPGREEAERGPGRDRAEGRAAQNASSITWAPRRWLAVKFDVGLRRYTP
jgi:hypothetical protein